MNMISLSTLHKEYVPQQYYSYITPLWCGFGNQKDYYISKKLTPYIEYIHRYIKDVQIHSLYNDTFLENLPHLYGEEREDIKTLQQKIQYGTPCKQEQTPIPPYYKILGLAYLLEQQEQMIQQEYMHIIKDYATLQQYIPSLSIRDTEQYIQPLLHQSLYNMMKAILYYCEEDPNIIFISHSVQLEEALSEYIVYSDPPHHFLTLLQEADLLSFYKGYIPKNNMNLTTRTILFLHPYSNALELT